MSVLVPHSLSTIALADKISDLESKVGKLPTTKITKWTPSTLPSEAKWRLFKISDSLIIGLSSDTDKAVYSEDGVEWYETSITLRSYSNVIFNSNIILALKYNSTDKAYAYSSDQGRTWNDAYLPITYFSDDSIYANGKFVIFGKGALVTSSDGINWSTITIPDITWGSIAYGLGKFVINSYVSGLGSDKLLYSEDGDEWHESTFPVAETWCSITFGGDRFIATSHRAIAAYSTDGINWLPTTPPTSLGSLTYGNGVFVERESNRIHSTSDGITWETTPFVNADSSGGVYFLNNRFVCPLPSLTNICCVSEDGKRWRMTQMPSTSRWFSFVSFGDKIITNGLKGPDSVEPSNILAIGEEHELSFFQSIVETIYPIGSIITYNGDPASIPHFELTNWQKITDTDQWKRIS